MGHPLDLGCGGFVDFVRVVLGLAGWTWGCGGLVGLGLEFCYGGLWFCWFGRLGLSLVWNSAMVDLGCACLIGFTDF